MGVRLTRCVPQQLPERSAVPFGHNTCFNGSERPRTPGEGAVTVRESVFASGVREALFGRNRSLVVDGYCRSGRRRRGPGHLKRGAMRLQGGGSSSSTRRIPGYNRGGPTREGVAGTRAAICLAMASLRRLCRAGFCCRLAGSQSLSGVPLFGSGLPLGDRSGKAGDAQHWQNKSQASNGFGETGRRIGNQVQFDPSRPRLVG
ncbi:uncharacterized protein P884DRAFT_55216 [Thermothelomyces heterothallicus CBS 202.75]|uniref:uncharacterized protein n=1 Tax=Thermothelomyces heterothallicus CBS 202.75 TaxID=1149848 RepID=UPI003742D1E7